MNLTCVHIILGMIQAILSIVNQIYTKIYHRIITQVGGFAVLKKSTSVQLFSSTTRPVPSNAFIETAAAEDVKITRLTAFARAHALNTFNTPWIAGLIMSFCTEFSRIMLDLNLRLTNKQHIKICSMIFSFLFYTSGSSEAKFTGVATWKTSSQPAIGASNLSSSVRSAPNIFSSPNFCSSTRCGTFLGSSAQNMGVRTSVHDKT